MSKTLVGAAGLPLAIALALSCGRCGSEPGNALKIVVPAMPTTLDWNTSDPNSWVNFPVMLATMRGLTTLGPDHRAQPGLAQSWEQETTAAGRQVITFHLRTDVKWSDGQTPLTAQDFVVGWRRTLLGNEPSDLADVVGVPRVLALRAGGAPDDEIKNALEQVEVRAVDAQTLQVTLDRPRSYFLPRMANVYVFFPAPSVALSGKTEDQIREYYDRPHPGRPLALGAYQLEEWDRSGERLRLRRNESSAFAQQGAPGTRPLESITLMKSEIGSALYERGRVDFVFVDNPVALRGNLPGDIHRQELLSTYFLGINTQRAPLDQPDVRRAIAMTLDRQALMSGLLPSARTSNVLLPPNLPGAADPTQSSRWAPFDPTRARDLLARAGGVHRPLRLIYSAAESFMPEVAIAERVQAQLRQAGIEVWLDPRMDFSTERGRLGADGYPAADLYLKRIGADYAHPKSFFAMFERGGNHATGWDQIENGAPLERFEQLLARGDEETDLDLARPWYTQAEKMLLDEYVVLVPLYHPDRYYRARTGLTGLTVDPFNFLFLRDVRWSP